MPDEARIWTDKELNKMEIQIQEIYRKSSKDINAERQDYIERGQKRLSSLYDEYMRSKNDEAKKVYMDAFREYTFSNDRYKEMLNRTTLKLANVNQKALEYLNGEMPHIYVYNYNYSKNLGVSFSLVDEATVRRRIVSGEILLPHKEIDIPKDQRWNTKQLNSSLLQGIIQGESIPKIAKRIEPVVDNNKAAAVRNARTMTSGAENEGRLDSYRQMESKGMVLKKCWIATPGNRTRDWHSDIDGQEVDIEEPFIVGNGDKLECPGDPKAHPRTVYNCRCSMKMRVVGMRMPDGSVKNIGG